MMKKLNIVLLASCFLLLVSCKKENLCDCLKGTGKMVREQRAVSDFNTLKVHDNIFVTITQDTINSLEIEAGENLLPLIKSKVENGVLDISNDNTCNWVRDYQKEIHVYVHVKNIFEMDSYTSKDWTGTNTITSPVIYIHNYNSGNMSLNISAQQSYTKLMAAAGDIYLTGSTDFSFVFIQTVGYMHLENFESNWCVVAHHGQGDVHLKAKDKLDAEINAEGNIFYSGNPVAQRTGSGSGELIHQ
jgi:hypothetical protein